MKRAHLILPMLIALGFFIQKCQPPCKSESYTNVSEVVADAKSNIQEITIEDYREMMQGDEMFTLIDVRTSGEHDAGYIPGSLNIPRGLLEFRIANDGFWEEEGMYLPEKEEILVLYCRSGNRSALATEALQQMEYKNVYSLQGGFQVWKEAFPDEVEKNIAPVEIIPSGVVTEEEDGGSC